MSVASRQRARLRTVGKVWSAWEKVQVTDRMREETAYLRNVHSVYRNSRYIVHLFACPSPLGAFMQVDVKRWTNEEISWEDLQRIKNDLFSPDSVALEVYPAQAISLETEANIRILWVTPTDWPLPMGTHLPTAWGGKL